MYSRKGIAQFNDLSLACAIHTDVTASVAHSKVCTKVPKMIESDHLQQEWPLSRKTGDSRWQALLTYVGKAGQEAKK